MSDLVTDVAIRQLLPISALLLSAVSLLFAGGINGLILPVQGNLEGFSSVSFGLLESWLGEKTDTVSRGRIFGIHTMINLGPIPQAT